LQRLPAAGGLCDKPSEQAHRCFSAAKTESDIVQRLRRSQQSAPVADHPAQGCKARVADFKSGPLPCPNLSAKTHRQAASDRLDSAVRVVIATALFFVQSRFRFFLLSAEPFPGSRLCPVADPFAARS
jgi:hypothetical protein